MADGEVNKRRKVLGVCNLAHVQHDGMVDMLYPLLPLLAQTFGLSYAEVGMIRAANKVAMAGLQLPAGLLSERLGERSLLAVGTIFSGLAFLLLGFSSGFVALVAFLFLAGCGNAVQHPLASTIITSAYAGPGRRAALGTYNFFGDVGKIAFAGATSLAIGAGVDWSVPVMTTGGIAISVGVAVFVVLAGQNVQGRVASQIGNEAPATTTGWGIKDKGGFFALCAIAVLDSSTRTGFLTFLAFLMLEKQVPEGWAATAVVMVFAGGMVGKLACGLLAERMGIIRTVVITEVATGFGIILVLFLPSPWSFFLLPFIGVALNGTSSVLYGTIGDLVEGSRQSRAFGLFYTLGSACGILAPLGYGLLGDVIGVYATMAVVGCAIFLTIPLCFMLRPAIGAARAVTPG
jgi:FSR family fosmidomycin resistance protein-like MFS transporter